MAHEDAKFDTRAIHAGFESKEVGTCQVPIYQTSAYPFKDAKQAADRFALDDLGESYSRLTNPTNAVLESRLAALEGGIAATVASSGHAAQLLAMQALMRPGDRFVASNRLYGGTTNQFQNTFRKHFGWECDFVDFDDLDAIKAAISENTKAIFCEALANPGGYVVDLEAVAKIARDAGIPFVVDNTLATPYLLRPIEWGADVVVHSTTKFLNGSGSAMGGAVIEAGSFDWKASEKHPNLTEPDASYNGLSYAQKFDRAALTVYAHAIGLRDLGPCQSPMNAFLTLNGIETLSLRMQRHADNAGKVAEFLEQHDGVSYVTYAGLSSSQYHDRAQKYVPKGAGALFTFGVNGGYDAAQTVVESVKIFSMVANLGDTRSLLIHPASTTHSQLTPEHREKIGLGDEMIRLSVGIEDVEDLMADLGQALDKAAIKVAA